MDDGSPLPDGRPDSLGAYLRDARLARGLELSEVAGKTSIRREMLKALEDGRYEQLPEDIYARHFVRLFAQTVGVSGTKALELYARERLNAPRAPSRPARERFRPPAERTPLVAADLDAEARAEDAGAAAAPGPRPTSSDPTPVLGAASDPVSASAPNAESDVAPDIGSQNIRSDAALNPDAPLEQGPTRAAAPAPARTTPARASLRRDPAPSEAEARRVSTLVSSRPAAPPRKPRRFGTWLPTLLLTVAVGGLAVWAFNALLFGPRAAPLAEEPVPLTGNAALPEDAAQRTVEDGESSATGTPTSLLSLVTVPPGAEVSVDGFALPGTTPLRDYALSATDGRSLRVSLEGYEPYLATVDLREDLALELTLTPEGGGAAAALTAPPVAGAEPVEVRVEEESWLEAYASTQRGVGERLLYTTAQPGETYRFPLPVYLHAGNAAGVRVTVNGEDRGAMGSSGEVLGRAFTQ